MGFSGSQDGGAAAYAEHCRSLTVASTPRAALAALALTVLYGAAECIINPAQFRAALPVYVVQLAVPLLAIALIRTRLQAHAEWVVLGADLAFGGAGTFRLLLTTEPTSGIALFLCLKMLGTAVLLPWRLTVQFLSAALTVSLYAALLALSGRAGASLQPLYQVLGPLLAVAVSVAGALNVHRIRRALLRDIAERQQAAAALRDSEAELRRLNTSISDYLWSAEIDERGTIRHRYFSPVVEQITGRPPEFYLAGFESWFSTIHPQDRPQVEQICAKIAAGASDYEEAEYRIVRPDGTIRWVRDRASVSREPCGRLRVNGVVSDVTERRESNERIVGLLENMDGGFFVLDQDSRIQYVNRSAVEIIRLPRSEIIGKNVWELFPEAVSAFYERYQSVQRTGVMAEVEAYYPPYNRWFRAHMYPAGNGICTLVEDITQQHAGEVALVSDVLRALNAHLDVARAFSTVDAALRSLTHCDYAALALLDDAGEWLTPIALGPAAAGDWLHVRWHLSDIPAAAANLLAGKPHVVQDLAAASDRPIVRSVTAQGFRSTMLLPLRGTDRVAGLLALLWRDVEGANPAQLPLLLQIADAVALAVEKKRLFDQVDAGRKRLEIVSKRLIEVQEAERRYIAYELHDEIGQILTGIDLVLNAVERLPAEVAMTHVPETRKFVHDLIARVRELSLDLRPPMLDDLGLRAALLWLFARYTAQTHIDVQFEHRGLEQRFPQEIETAAYRIVQEALTNTARHAGVHAVQVSTWVEQQALDVRVVDHGNGFDADTVFATGSTVGLAGMRERALLLGGRLLIDSAPGQGTRLTAELPLPAARRRETVSPTPAV